MRCELVPFYITNQTNQLIPCTTEMVKFGKESVNGKLVAKGVDASFLNVAQPCIVCWYAHCTICTIVTLDNTHLFSTDVLPGKVVRSLGYSQKTRLLILSYAVSRVGVNNPLVSYFKLVGYA